jgi:hypothetical protein
VTGAEAVVLLAVVAADSEADVLAVVAWLALVRAVLAALEMADVLAALEDAGATVPVVVAAPPQAARPRLVLRPASRRRPFVRPRISIRHGSVLLSWVR